MAKAIRIIKTRDDYEIALKRVDALMDAEPGTPQGDELELLATLIEMYEDSTFPIGMPSVAEAIRFRMDQMSLRPRDLIPYIGSAARVSEILAGKRPLTLKMARALHKGLGIPADILLQEDGAELPEDLPAVDWSRFPISAMLKAGWFTGFRGTVTEARECAEELVRGMLERGGLQPALLRAGVRSGAEMDTYALTAWQARVQEIARSKPISAPYQPGSVDDAFIRETVRLSYLDEGPRLVRDFLGKSGIHFIVLSHLPRTHLDGAAMKGCDGKPIVALTLRHDRLDNFWFCLAHELAHVSLHLGDDNDLPYFDDLDLMGDGLEQVEKEADNLAIQSLINEAAWEHAAVRSSGHPRDVRTLALSLRINPAIVAGRYRYENRNYRALTGMVGLGDVRRQFPEVLSGE